MISALAISFKSTSAWSQLPQCWVVLPHAIAAAHLCPPLPGGCASSASAVRGPMGLCKLCPVGLVLAQSAVPRLSGKCCRPVAWPVSSLGVAHPGCAYGMSLHPLLLPCSTHTLLQPLLQLSGAGWLWQGPYGAAKELVWSLPLLGAASCRDSPPPVLLPWHTLVACRAEWRVRLCRP